MDPPSNLSGTKRISRCFAGGTGIVSRLPAESHVIPGETAGNRCFDTVAHHARGLFAKATRTPGFRRTRVTLSTHPTQLWGGPAHRSALTLSPEH